MYMHLGQYPGLGHYNVVYIPRGRSSPRARAGTGGGGGQYIPRGRSPSRARASAGGYRFPKGEIAI